MIGWNRARETKPIIGGLAGWLAALVTERRRPAHRLELLERITLAPRQSLALIEAEGRRLLVATSAEGSPVFYNLDGFGNLDGLGNLEGLRATGNPDGSGQLDGPGNRGIGPQSGAGPRSQRRVSW